MVLAKIREKAHRQWVHKVSEKLESWTHVAYCSVLYIEGHGLYATIGGVLGIVVLVTILTETHGG